MRRNRKSFRIRVITALVGASLILQSAGCTRSSDPQQMTGSEVAVSGGAGSDVAGGGAETNAPGNNAAETGADGSAAAESGNSDAGGQASGQSAQTETKKEYVWDFDALVNDEWRASVAEKMQTQEMHWYSYSEEIGDQRLQRFGEILDTADLSGIPEDSDLYKVITVYREILDVGSDAGEFRKEIKDRLDHIGRVKNLKDLNALLYEKTYCYYNLGMSREVVADEGGNIQHLEPTTILGDRELSPEICDVVRQYLIDLGFSGKRADEMLKNTLEAEKMIHSFNEKCEEKCAFDYWYTECLSNMGVQFPVYEILEDLDEIGYAKAFMAHVDYPTFLKEYYTAGNVLKIRDHMMITLVLNHSKFDEEFSEQLNAVGFYDERDYKNRLRNWTLSVAGDTLIPEYHQRYLNDANMQSAEGLLQDIKLTLKAIITDSDWLTLHGKELAKRKISKMKCCLWENGNRDELSDVTLTGNTLEDIDALRFSRTNFDNSQLWAEYEGRNLFNTYPFVMSACYQRYYNAFVISSGFLEMEGNDIALSKEELLADFGVVAAHEIAHTYGPNAIQFDDEGYYEPWFKDEETEAYKARVERTIAFFDGMEIGEGVVLDGAKVCAETFADLMAMECCLRLLEQMENPDYDLFFKRFARNHVDWYESGFVEEYTKDDPHLPGKQRINYVLAQFDRFYETYDVDPESPYYVPEDERLSSF